MRRTQVVETLEPSRSMYLQLVHPEQKKSCLRGHDGLSLCARENSRNHLIGCWDLSTTARRGDDADKKLKLSIKEASHWVRVIQALDADATRTKSAREIRWQMAAKELEKLAPNVLPNLTGKNITELYRLYPGYFVIMRNKKMMYIGEVLDIYKKGNNSKYGSLEFATTASSLSFLAVRVYLPLQLGNALTVMNPTMQATTNPHRHHCSHAVGEANMTCTPMLLHIIFSTI